MYRFSLVLHLSMIRK